MLRGRTFALSSCSKADMIIGRPNLIHHVDGRLDACVFMEDEKMSKNWVNQRILQLAISVEVLCDLRSIGFSTRP